MKRLLLASLSSTAAVCVCISDGGNIPTRIRHPRNKVEENVQESRREKRRWRNNFSFFFKFLVSFCLQRTAACSQPTTDYFTRSLLFLYSVVSLSLSPISYLLHCCDKTSVISFFFISFASFSYNSYFTILYSTFLVLSFSFWCSFFFLSFFLALSLFIYLYPIVLPSIIRFNSVQSPFRSPFSFHISFHPSHHVLLLSSWSSWSSTLFYCRCFPFFLFYSSCDDWGWGKKQRKDMQLEIEAEQWGRERRFGTPGQS